MVLRSLYLDPKLDTALGSRAEAEGITKAELMRRFLTDGLARPATKLAGYAEGPRRAKAEPAKTESKPGRKAAVGSNRR